MQQNSPKHAFDSPRSIVLSLIFNWGSDLIDVQVLVLHEGKSLSEALIFASTNPQYDNRLFIVHENCKLRIPAEHVHKLLFLFGHSEQFWYTTCSADAASFWERFPVSLLWSYQTKGIHMSRKKCRIPKIAHHLNLAIGQSKTCFW